MSNSRKRAISSPSLSVPAPAIYELERAHRTLQESIGELKSTVSTLKNLIENVEKDQQERNRLTRSGTLVL